MEVVTEGGRRVWELPFNAIEPRLIARGEVWFL